MLNYDMPMADYRRLEGVSASDLKNMQRSPAYARLRPDRPTEAKAWGSAVHCAILEPDQLENRYGHDPESPKGGYPAGWRNTKEYREAKAALLATPGIEGVLTGEEWGDLRTIARNVADNQIGAMLHDLPGSREVSLVATDNEFGCKRKCRPDWLIPSAHMIVDVKTAQDWRPRAFARAAHGYGYHMIAAYYLDTFALAEDAPPIDHYVFLVVASDAPYEVASYTLDSDSLAQGRHDYRRALAQWTACKASGNWPGGADKIQEIRLPEYGINYFKDEETDQW